MIRYREGMSLRANVLAAIVTATAALVLALILLEGPLVEYRQITHARGSLMQIAEHVARAVEQGNGADRIADLYGAHEAARVTVLDLTTRTVIGDTAHDGPDIEREVKGREIDQALSYGEGWTVPRRRNGPANAVYRRAPRQPDGQNREAYFDDRSGP